MFSSRRSRDDVESGGSVASFEDDNTRRNFIKRVYLILSLQLLVTFGCVLTLSTSDEFMEYVEENPSLLLIALIVMVVTMISLVCCNEFRRKPPLNYIFLILFTLAEAFLLCVISSTYEPEIVLMALGLTVVISVTLSLYAMQTKVDYTAMGGFLLVCMIILIIVGIVALFFPTKLIRMVYCSFGVVLFSIFLIYDTQLMLGGNHSYSISPDEYVFAALNLYVDIVQIFIFLLHILGNE